MSENSLKDFFNNCEIRDIVPVSEDQSENIKSSLQKRLAGDHQQPERPTKEEKIMKKSTTIRTVLIAAAVAAAGAISLIGSANTVPVSDFIAPESSVTESNAPEDIVPDETDTLSEYDYFYAEMDKKHPNFDHEAKDFFARTYAEIGRERLAEMNDFYDQLDKEYLANEEKHMAELAEEDRIIAELAEKNTFTEEYKDYLKTHYTDAELNNIICTPSYEEMVVTELIVTETSYSDYRGMSTLLTDWGITLKHGDPRGGGHSVLIHPDGSGGYQYYKYRDSAPIEDEQLLAAIAEGTEKYGDTFTIYY